MKFPYRKYEIFYKPVLPVIFKLAEKKFSYQALIDTGADVSIIHAEIAEQLGIEVKAGKKFAFGGICGTGLGYVHKANIEIGGYVFQDVPIIFTQDINPYGFGILGHKGLFEKMKLVFEVGKKQFELIPKDYKNKSWKFEREKNITEQETSPESRDKTIKSGRARRHERPSSEIFCQNGGKIPKQYVII